MDEETAQLYGQGGLTWWRGRDNVGRVAGGGVVQRMSDDNNTGLWDHRNIVAGS